MGKTIIIDYGMGNLFSVKKKLKKIGFDCEVSNIRQEIEAASKLILPGVGHFSMAVQNLKTLGLWNAINDAVLEKKTPILGICLGMQLMAKHSEEGDTHGFGWFDAHVQKFKITDKLKYKVPHMGWNDVKLVKPSILFDGVPQNTEFYFVHSYHLICHNPNDALNETTYEYPFVSAIEKDNIFGLQYHPEKSHDAGEIILRNFMKL